MINKRNHTLGKILLSFLLIIVLMLPVGYSYIIFEKNVTDNFLLLNSPLEEEHHEESHSKEFVSVEYTLPLKVVKLFGCAALKRNANFISCFLIGQQGAEVITPPPEGSSI